MLKKILTLSLLTVGLLTAQLAVSAGELLGQNTFDQGVGLPWHTCETAPAKTEFDITGGKYVVKIIEPGTNRWDCQFRHRSIKMQSGHQYTVKASIKASNNCKIYVKIGDQKDPYYEDWNYPNRSWQEVSITANQTLKINETFSATRNAEVCEFAIHIGGPNVPAGTIFEFDDMYLSDPQAPTITPTPTPIPKAIRVNQLGYFPAAKKRATLVTSSSSATSWKLKNSSGTEVASGTTKTFGADADSGDNVQIIDFSDFKTVGTGYVLTAGSAESYPFDIGNDLYSKLKYDSLRYFYYGRSGIAIQLPYCVESQWARPAGHPSDILPAEKTWGYSSDHKLDITGGWYDAGDHGKYVVNGGITLWTLQNMYERTLNTTGSTDAPYANGKMNIPESSNNYPDLLDETRWHMEVMLKMQVPSGLPRAGMAHHKGHDESWTGLAVRPDEDTKDRILKPPTTAATLNLAATGAQAYRLWKKYDSTFANKCLTAAEIAWEAAVANPEIYAPFDEARGGGPYGDDYVLDDFYWAAAELYVTTGKSKYLDYIKSSPHYLEMPSLITEGEETNTFGCFNWGNTQGLGTITLALVPSNLSAEEVQKARNNICAAADAFIAAEEAQGYGVPMKQCKVLQTGLTGYPWGSNSFIINSAIVMAYAYDFSKKNKYFSGATEAMDYILGRNANDFSYVTGYGENHLTNPHHRFFANQVDPNYPVAPPGIVSGGPNSGLQDPWVKGSGWKPGVRPPQKCYMDHIESWSTNECTINWNAPLSWITGYLDEVAPKVDEDEEVTPGDLNDDGSINSVDLALIRRVLLGVSGVVYNEKAADVNSDGSVNSIDLAELKRKLL